MYRNGERIDVESYCIGRKKLSPNEENVLLEEVNSRCPIIGCGKSLINQKGGQYHKEYEIAHIFPNSPSDMEKVILENVEVDGENSESLSNKILLCHNCHKAYDNGKTAVSYQQMLDLKRKLANDLKAKKEISMNSIEEDIAKAIDALVHLNPKELEKAGRLEYQALNVAEKVKEDAVLRMDIEDRVTRYFNYIRQVFKYLDPSGEKFELICISVRKLYLQLKLSHLSQSDIFEQLSDWFSSKTHTNSNVCGAMTSFFVQNCDVYEIS